MASKISTALIRKEADTYRAQGLHKEARALYARFLADAAEIDPATESVIKKQIRLIELEMNCDDGEAQDLSAEQIDLIKVGWRGSASEADVLQSAQTLMEVGRWVDALKEFGKMIYRGSAVGTLSPLIAECFARLCGPRTLPAKVGSYSKVLFADTEHALEFQVAIAEQLARRGKQKHAAALFRALNSDSRGSHAIKTRLAELRRQLGS